MKEYNPDEIEPKWQQKWAEEGLYEADDASEKEHRYVLDMFPYPSGSGLHVGHVEGYTASDIYSRFLRMNDKEVLHPMGWDAFGLPAENYAIKTGVHPRETTDKAIATFTQQIKRLGLSYDWSREINTSKPDYYKWTQWLFLELFKNDLAERKEANVNWCPSCQTVLANEQVVDGLCERCDTEVEQKSLLQWFFTITDYADDLIEEVDTVDWPESTKTAQKNWIGKSEGAYIDFDLNTKQRFVLLHGFKASPEMNFHPTLKDELESRGHEVVVPELPNPNDPSIDEQAEYVLEHVDFDDNTVLLGHSLGTVVAMKVAERLDVELSELILVAPFIDAEFKDGDPRSFSKEFDYEFDFDAIQRNARDILILDPEEDDAVSEEQVDRVHKAIGGRREVIPVDKLHARGKNEPAVLRHAIPNLRVFTTRPDTLFGATYMVLAPEHPAVSRLKSEINNWHAVEEYVRNAQKKSEQERTADERDKTGVLAEGISATNPATGEEIPIYVADYVLVEYGTGAIMAVPAHDERDFAFAKNHDIPIRQVIAPHVIDEVNPPQEEAENTTRDVVHCLVRNPETDEFIALEWKEHDWLTFVTGGVEGGEDVVDAGKREIIEETGYSDITFVEKMPLVVRADFYAAHKEVNREINAHVLLFDLESDQRKEIADEEKEKHDVTWMPMAEMETLSPVSELDYILRWFDEGAYAYTEEGELINSGQFDGLSSTEAKEKITSWLEENKNGEKGTNYKLRDWSIGRQRYWGVPIPIVYDPDGNPHAVPQKHLPWELPSDVEFEPHGEAPLAQSDELLERTEDVFGDGWTPEVDTMDAFVCSSWYYLRYADPQNNEEFASEEALDTWLPVDLYVGGAEHTVMHLLYARFITKVLNDLGYLEFREPFSKLRHQGMILAEDGRKMSKSLGNVVNPNDVVDQFGADSIRLFEMFLGPLSDAKPWQTDSIVGVRRFLEKVWRVADQLENEVTESVETKLHQTIRKVTEDTKALKFNTAISSMMECINLMEKETVTQDQYHAFLRLLAPYAPHITEELWHDVLLNNDTSVHGAQWPTFDEEKATEETVTIAVQVNGTVRGEVEIPNGSDKETAEKAARGSGAVQKWLNGPVEKIIYVKNRLINFVVEN